MSRINYRYIRTKQQWLFRTIYIFLVLFVCLMFAFPKKTVAADIESDKVVESEAGTFGKRIRQIGRGLSLHKQNYILPLTWSNDDSEFEDAEVKFQLSLKQHLLYGFYVAYTQKSFWKVLDSENSKPFRETNYNPEFFYRFARESSWGKWGGDIGYEHESNGSSEPTSRSWDRLYIAPGCEYKNIKADLKIWYRIPEDEKEYEGDTSGDDNPDIEDYYGYSELKLRYEWQNHHMLSMIGRLNFNTGNGGIQMDYSFPTPSKNMFLFFQLWSGYGESLIDYNHYITSVGVGIMLKR